MARTREPVPVDTPEGPGMLLPYTVTVDDRRIVETGWFGMVEYPDGRRRVWRFDQIDAIKKPADG